MTTPGPLALFRGFLGIGMMGFGGVLPLARRALVDRLGWLNEAAFTDLLGLCQVLPGGNIINLSVAVGLRFAGIAGAFAALSGLIAVPLAVIVALGGLYARFGDDPHLRHLFAGLAAAACGMMIALALRMAGRLRGDPAACAIALGVVAAVGWARWPLLAVMAVAAPLGMLAARRSRAKPAAR
ncbi:chromate transporter [Endobacter medicaginis]|uniref:Chromate transporter n=3 Tax=Endobacter medicaginis TaxID=1181271 RepID=A0A839V3D9_9PROT|nr:chromate transporter [Endobacter medicaginis]MCX5476331.1 chromate transporter [Endobacter medicaginis]